MFGLPEWLVLVSGQVFVGLIGLSFLLTLIGVGLILINAYRDRFFLPRATLVLFTSFRYPIKAILRMVGMPGTTIDRLSLDIRNTIQRPFFSTVPPGKRMAFFPQCLRDLKCPARTSPEYGIMCSKCGKCVIGSFKEKGEDLGYMGVYIVPGSSFIKRIVKRDGPSAVLGIACTADATAGMEMLEAYGLPAHSVYLLKEGCVNTVVDADRVLEIMELGCEKEDVPPSSVAV